MNGTRTFAGHSLPVNLLMVLANLVGLTFLTMGYHASFEAQKTLFISLGYGLMFLSTIGLIFFKGRIMMATIARVLVGGLFIVSGLIKANDPVGFSYKLEEYFEDGALAYRIKEWFGAPGFSLEFLIQFAVILSVIICIAEIVLGVLVLIGGKMRIVSWSLMVMMLFFTFLTWHTANCDNKVKFTDRDTYGINSSTAQVKLEESKTNKDIKIVSKNSTEIVVDELRSPQCVSDCGCFGDAMKGSVGRSLTPQESLWKDIILLYLVIWIFAAQKRISGNTVRENWIIIPCGLLLITFFSWVFGWYFPLLFGIISLVAALWIYRSGGKFLGNHYGSALITSVLCALFVGYVLRYDPLKDYRPYAVGNDLNPLMTNGDPGKYSNMLVYSNLKTKAIKEFDGSSKVFLDSKIWEDKNWKYDTMVTKEIRPMRLPSIDSTQFNPSLELADVSADEMKLPFIKKQFKRAKVVGLQLEDVLSKEQMEITEAEYNIESYPLENYSIIDTIEVDNPDFTGVSIRDFITSAPRIVVLVSKSLADIDVSKINELKQIAVEAEKNHIPVVFITSAAHSEVVAFKKKYNFHVPTFTNDPIELKVISRSNPCVLVLKKGKILGKYTAHSLPTFSWIKSNLL